jgi:hypothetical protein
MRLLRFGAASLERLRMDEEADNGEHHKRR